MNRDDASGWCYRKKMNSAARSNEDHIWQPFDPEPPPGPYQTAALHWPVGSGCSGSLVF